MTAIERKVKLTDRVLNAAKAEARRYMIWDTDKKGLGLRVGPLGHQSFIVGERWMARALPYGHRCHNIEPNKPAIRWMSVKAFSR